MPDEGWVISSHGAEISNRTHRFENGEYVRPKGVGRRELNVFETRRFQPGRKRLEIITGAGSTGISMHADVDAKNQQRHVFYALQLSWFADQQMQAFRRVQRSNQTSAPVIRSVLLDLAGQKRLVNAVSKRLAALDDVPRRLGKEYMDHIEIVADGSVVARYSRCYERHEQIAGVRRRGTIPRSIATGICSRNSQNCGKHWNNGTVRWAAAASISVFCTSWPMRRKHGVCRAP